MKRAGRRGDLEEIFEVLVTTYGQKGGALPADGDLCWRPATDVYETDTEFVIQMDLAGMDPSQIAVAFDGQALVIRGIRDESADPGAKHFHTMEISVGPFVRRIPVIDGLDPDSATACYRGGFLFVTLRRGKPRPVVRRRIDIDR